ncbi:hypothetical protein ZOSMA_140G00220 [Zostera marina]|uniref:Uncharacterized protein n=1 Tax=Zostera marina TaxID=29655 RepID=A0A0K9PXY6_ZOSMR|nr:hypothetical protein ZOSMA_140G00220 [Zostera marina]
MYVGGGVVDFIHNKCISISARLDHRQTGIQHQKPVFLFPTFIFSCCQIRDSSAAAHP